MAATIKGGNGNASSPVSLVGKLTGTAAEANERFAYDAKRREFGQRILRPGGIDGQHWDVVRTLETTLGGKGYLRPITIEDLKKFKKNIAKVQKQFTAGITPRQVLDYSLDIDRERAQKEIRWAIPVQSSGHKIRFITSAGPKSKDQRHYVMVELLSFGAAVSAGRGNPKQMANWLRKEPLKFDCDCGRHTFWYRYIASIGGYNAGRAETGYPKEKNPNLHGIACKHVIRVMAEIESSMRVGGFFTRMIETARERDKPSASRVRTTQKEAEEMAKKMAARPRAIKTTLSRDAAKSRNAIVKAIKTAPKPIRASSASRKVALAKDQKEAAALLAAQFGMTVAQVLTLLAKNAKG